MSDLVAVIRDGRIGQTGTPQELYEHPVDPAMAEFLGDANLIRDRWRAPSPRRRSAPCPAGGHRPVGGTPVCGRVDPARAGRDLARSGRPRPGRPGGGSHFHGHDTVMRILPDASSGISCIVARTDGGLALAPGTEVTVTARGPVLAWPDDG